MKEPVVLLIAALLALLCTAIIPSTTHAQPAPPQSPDAQWQPPDEGGVIDPPVGVEIFNSALQGTQDLQLAPPAPVAPGVNASITSAYLVNSYGQILNTLYRGELCYLILSVNGPGYLYLWEYYPSGNTYGHWLCYKWYRPGAGVWRIGPFAAGASDPEGQYSWKLWYLSGRYWSTRVLNFNYIRGHTPYTTPLPTPVPIPTPAPQPVYQPAEVKSFTASPSTIEAGQSVTLSWSTGNATSVIISPGVGTVGVSGSTMVTPSTTTVYTLTATGRTGNPASSSLTVNINPRVAPTLSADRTGVPKGQPVTLTWSAPGAKQVSISGIGGFDPSGRTSVIPETNSVYTLTAAYYDGSTQQTSVNVNVEESPLLLFGLLALLAVAAAIIVILLIRRSIPRTQPTTPLPQEGVTQAAVVTAPVETTRANTSVITMPAARLSLPDGSEIVLAGSDRCLGRRDFEKFLPQEKLTYISRQHFTISCEDDKYYIEDHASTNGTLVNGTEIRSVGRRVLEDNDAIEIATKLKITFNINTVKEVN